MTLSAIRRYVTIGTIRVRCKSPSGKDHGRDSSVEEKVEESSSAGRVDASASDQSASGRGDIDGEPACPLDERLPGRRVDDDALLSAPRGGGPPSPPAGAGRAAAASRRAAAAATRSWNAASGSTAGDRDRGHEPAAVRHEDFGPQPETFEQRSMPEGAPSRPVDARFRRLASPDGPRPRRARLPAGLGGRQAGIDDERQPALRRQGHAPAPVRAEHPAGHRPDGDPGGHRRRRTDRPHPDDPDQAHGRLAGLLDRQLGGTFQDQGGQAVLAVEDRQRRPLGDHPARRPCGFTRPLSIASSHDGKRGNAQSRGTRRIEPEQVRGQRQ